MRGMTNIFLLIFSVFCVIFCTFAFTNLSLRKRNTENRRNFLYECHRNIMNKYIPYTFSCMTRWIQKGKSPVKVQNSCLKKIE